MQVHFPSDEPELGVKSLRSSLDARKSAHVSDVRKKSLFDMVDHDKSGAIDREEFGELYDVLRDQTEKDIVAKLHRLDMTLVHILGKRGMHLLIDIHDLGQLARLVDYVDLQHLALLQTGTSTTLSA